MDEQQPHSQVFDHFRVSGFIRFAGLVGLEASLGDFGRIAKKLSAFGGQFAAPLHLPQPEAVQQTLAPDAQGVGALAQRRIVVGQQRRRRPVQSVELRGAILEQLEEQVADGFRQLDIVGQVVSGVEQPPLGVQIGVGAQQAAQQAVQLGGIERIEQSGQAFEWPLVDGVHGGFRGRIIGRRAILTFRERTLIASPKLT